MGNVLDKEWKSLRREEKKFLNANIEVRTGNWQKKLEKHIPEKLNQTLKDAFCKAFELVFEKGTGFIEKTYNKTGKQQEYKINDYTARLKGNRRAYRAFSQSAKAGKKVNMAVSTVEGIGMGALGLGIPDVPVFIAVVLKAIYEIALSYGFTYDTKEDKIFILKVMETSLLHGADLMAENLQIDQWIRGQKEWDVTLEAQMQKTATVMAEEMLCLKFIQGLPLVGIVGGLSDVVYQKRITDYAEMKYHRRFLSEQI